MRIADPETTIAQQVGILRLLRTHGSQTRRQLAALTSHSFSLVRQLTENLAGLGFIEPVGNAPGETAGRPSQLWSLAPDACLALGLHVGSTSTRIVILDAHGHQIDKITYPKAQVDTADALLQTLAGHALAMLTRLGERRAKVQGVGVAFSGFVDFRQGLSLDAMHIAHANALPLQRYLANVLALPVIMDDSARAVALAEVRYGAARHSRNCICVSVGQGIGTGVIIDGQLYRGALGLAGELGHIPVSLGGTPCRCGGHGCLETLASGAAVLARARTLLEQGMPSRLHALCDQDYARLTPGLITEAALAGDEMALSLLRHVGQWLGLGLAILGNLYSPELLVLTGSVMRGNTLLLDMVRQEMQRYLLPPLRSSLKVVLTALDDAAGASGAATFILDDAFERGFAHRLGAVHPPAPVLES